MRHGKEVRGLWVQVDVWMEMIGKTEDCPDFSFYVCVFMCDSVDMCVSHMSALTVHSPFTLFKAGSFVCCYLMLGELVYGLQEILLCKAPASDWSAGIMDGLCHIWLGQNPGDPNSGYQVCLTSILLIEPAPGFRFLTASLSFHYVSSPEVDL